jgi:hypothetical protein
MCAVAWAGHALVSGRGGSRLRPRAIVSPTDPLAAATIMRGRFDDATALVACRVVVAGRRCRGHPAAITIVALTLLWPSSWEARFGVETFSCDGRTRARGA